MRSSTLNAENFGHIKVECPQLKRKRHSGDSKKSLIITWDDSKSEKSSSLDNEQVNISLMTNTNENELR